MMTRERALDIIQNVWGQKTVASKALLDEVEANKIESDASDLATLARIAELPEVLTIQPFNTDSVYWLCSRVRAERQVKDALEKATQRK